MNNSIEELKTKGYAQAPEIYVMPEIIKMEKLMDKYEGMHSVPVGIFKESLDDAYYDFNKKVTTIISSNEFENMQRFIKNYVNCLSLGESKFTSIVVDANNFFETFDYKMSYLNDKFNEVIDAFIH